MKKREVAKIVIGKKEIASNKQEEYYNKGKKENKFEEGDRVMVKNNNKKSWKEDNREGPYIVEKDLGRGNYLLKDITAYKWKSMNIEAMELVKLNE